MTIEIGLTLASTATFDLIAQKKDFEQYSQNRKLFSVLSDVEGISHFVVKKRRKKSIALTLSRMTISRYNTFLNNYLDQTIPLYCKVYSVYEVLFEGFCYIEATQIITDESLQRYTVDIIIHEI